MGEDEKFIVTPAAYFFAGTQRIGKGALHAFKHGLAGASAVRAAHVARLVHGDPQDAKGSVFVEGFTMRALQPLAHLRLAGQHFGTLSGFAVRKRRDAIGRMEDRRSADARAKIVAESHPLDEDRHIVSAKVLQVQEDAIVR
jgi:hypothetical protein